MTASGTAGHGAELGAYFDLSRLGAVVVKSLSAGPWAGNPAPRLVPVAAGMLNSIGLQNPGVEAWLRHDLPDLRRAGARVVVSVWGRTIDEYAEVGRRLARDWATTWPTTWPTTGPARRRGRGRHRGGRGGQHQLPEHRGPPAYVLALGRRGGGRAASVGQIPGPDRLAHLGQVEPERHRPGLHRPSGHGQWGLGPHPGQHTDGHGHRPQDGAGPPGGRGRRPVRAGPAPGGRAGRLRMPRAPSRPCPSSEWAGL